MPQSLSSLPASAPRCSHSDFSSLVMIGDTADEDDAGRPARLLWANCPSCHTTVNKLVPVTPAWLETLRASGVI